MNEKRLGKIANVRVGKGGYQDAMVGVTFDIEGQGWGIGDFWGFWSTKITASTKWTDMERRTVLGDTMMHLHRTLVLAKKNTAGELVGVPVEVETKNNQLVSWRVLTEVL